MRSYTATCDRCGVTLLSDNPGGATDVRVMATVKNDAATKPVAADLCSSCFTKFKTGINNFQTSTN
jgi:hypothetical protein